MTRKDAIRRLVDTAPPLRPDQRAAIAMLLPPVERQSTHVQMRRAA